MLEVPAPRSLASSLVRGCLAGPSSYVIVLMDSDETCELSLLASDRYLLLDLGCYQVGHVIRLLTHLVIDFMSMNFQSDSLPMSRVIIRLARGRTCDLSVGRVFVPEQVCRRYMCRCMCRCVARILTPCQSSMQFIVKGRQNPWGMGDLGIWC